VSLNAALVDRGRVVRKVAGAKVQGRSRVTDVHGAWFRVRLMPGPVPEGEDEQRGRRRTSPSPSLMAAVKDEAGELVEIRSSDEIEVDSPELGLARWRVTGDPEPMRKKRRVIGWTVTLERLVEPARDEVAS
jgi:hypothetical protein